MNTKQYRTEADRAAYANGYAWGKNYGQSGPTQPYGMNASESPAWADGYDDGEWFAKCRDQGACP